MAPRPEYVETVEQLKARMDWAIRDGRKCCLLIGAGCSASAEIPTASKFVATFKKEKQQYYNYAADKARERRGQDFGEPTFAECMEVLTEDERRKWITDAVKGAKINWAHIGIALLIQKGYVDRILTTNFDPLIVRACALLGEFPSVYDVAVAQKQYAAGAISDPSVLYLHGQHHGFMQVMRRFQMDRAEYRTLVREVIRDVNSGNRLWIVVGYSGQEDPVFEELCGVETYPRRLYWVGYRQEGPPEHVAGKLLTPGKDAFFVKGEDDNFDADSFFIPLTQQLGIFPPDLFLKPFSHLNGLLDGVADFPVAGSGSPIALPREWIRTAIRQFEQGGPPPPGEAPPTVASMRQIAEAMFLLMAGKHEDLSARYATEAPPPGSELASIVSAAYLNTGNDAYRAGEKATGSEARALFEEAAEKFQRAVELKPDSHEAYSNWGAALNDLGRREEAIEKCQKAVELKPDSHEAYNNWGNALYDLGRHEEAIEKYRKAVELKPDSHEAYNNWGVALNNLGRREEAIEKYQKAVELKPDSHEAYNNWGVALDDLGRREEAVEKFQKAVELKPDSHEAYYNWGAALDDLGRYEEAIEKFQKAVELKPDYPEAYNNWGTALGRLGRYEEAVEKFQKAVELKPDSHEAYNNWGVALNGLGRHEEAIEKCQKAVELKPDSHEAYNNWGVALDNLGRHEEAIEKCQRAVELKPDSHEAYNNWGVALDGLGRHEEAVEKFQRAVELKPDYPEAYYNWGGALNDLGRHEEAIEKCQKAAELKPDYHEAYNNWGAALGHLGRREEAIEKFRKAEEILRQAGE